MIWPGFDSETSPSRSGWATTEPNVVVIKNDRKHENSPNLWLYKGFVILMLLYNNGCPWLNFAFVTLTSTNVK